MLISTGLLIIAMCSFALKSRKHYQLLFKIVISERQQNVLNLAAWGGLVLSQIALWQQPQLGFAWLYWLGALSLTIVAIGLALSAVESNVANTDKPVN